MFWSYSFAYDVYKRHRRNTIESRFTNLKDCFGRGVVGHNGSLNFADFAFTDIQNSPLFLLWLAI